MHQLQFILFGLTLISSTVLALYPAANYDSIVKSSVLIQHKPANHNQVHNHHEQSHVTNRNGAFLITNFKKPEEEKPHRALVIRKPVLITSLSNHPAEIIETNKNHEIVNVKQISSHPPCDEDKIKKVVITQKQPVIIYKKPEKPVTTTVKPEVHEEKPNEPLKFTINIEQPKPVVTKNVYEVRRPSVVVPYGYGLHSNQVHGQFFHQPSYYYAPQIQPVIPQQYGYGYTIYGHPSIPKPIYKPHIEYISKPNYEVPKLNSSVSFVQKEVPHYVSYPNTVQQFGYSFTAPIQPVPPKVLNVTNYVYTAPKPQQNSTVSFVQKEIPYIKPQPNHLPLPVRQFGYSFTVPSQPAPPKVVNVPHHVHSVPKPQENVAFVEKEISHYASQPNVGPLPVRQFGYSFTVPSQPAPPKVVNVPHHVHSVPKPQENVAFVEKEVSQYASQPNIGPLPVRQFGYSFTVPSQPAPPNVVNVPHHVHSVPKPQENVAFVEKEISHYASQPNVGPLPVRQFGYSFTVPSQPAPPKVVNVPHHVHSVPKPQENVAFVEKEVSHYASQPNVGPLPVRQFGYSFTAPIQPTPPKVVNVQNYVQSAPKPHVHQPNIIPTPVRQFGYSYVTEDKPVAKPSTEYAVPSKNVENNAVHQPQRFGFSYTIHNQPAIGHPESKPSTENHVTKPIQPVPKPSTEYGVPKLIQPVPKPSTEYGVPKVSNFGPIVVAPFDPLASAPFATNQHLPIVDKHVQFSSS